MGQDTKQEAKNLQGRKFIFAPKFKFKWIVELVPIAKMCELYICVIFAFSCEFNRKNNLHSHFNVNSKEEQSTILLSCELKGFWVCELCVIIFVQTKFSMVVK